jgi:hypothetical protein
MLWTKSGAARGLARETATWATSPAAHTASRALPSFLSAKGLYKKAQGEAGEEAPGGEAGEGRRTVWRGLRSSGRRRGRR